MKSWKNKLSRNQSASLQDQHSKITASNSSRRSKANKFSTILQFRPINLSIRLSLQLTINLGAFFQPGTTWVAWSANDCNTVVNAPRRFTGFPAVLINGRVIISVRRSVALQWPPRRHADYQPGITTNLSPPVVFHRSRIWVKSELRWVIVFGRVGIRTGNEWSGFDDGWTIRNGRRCNYFHRNA